MSAGTFLAFAHGNASGSETALITFRKRMVLTGIGVYVGPGTAEKKLSFWASVCYRVFSRRFAHNLSPIPTTYCCNCSIVTSHC